jgi:hypothetical protein
MPVGAMDCGDKIYALDVVDNRAVVGTKDRRVLVWDVRTMKAPLQVRESPLKVGFDVSYIIQLFPVSNSQHQMLPIWRGFCPLFN